MKTKKGIVWLIERRRYRAGPFLNSVRVEYWRTVGRLRAATKSKALDRAQEITGAERKNLRVSGVAADGREYIER